MDFIVRDIGLAASGQEKINGVENFMPVLNTLNDELSKTKPLQGKRLVVTIHLEAKTAYLAISIKKRWSRGCCYWQ